MLTVIALLLTMIGANSTLAIVDGDDDMSVDVAIVTRATKICQLTGDLDLHLKVPTVNRTRERWRLEKTDLGIPVAAKDRTWVLFGDTFGPHGGDAIAWTTDTDPEKGIKLNFVAQSDETYAPIVIPGISQGAFEVPTGGICIGNKLYVAFSTDHSDNAVMGRTVLALSEDDGKTFRLVCDISKLFFINVAMASVRAEDWPGLPVKEGNAILLFGSGTYRQSDVRLACVPESNLEDKNKYLYLSGFNGNRQPVWSDDEKEACPLFHHPEIGELSVTYNRFLKRWIMLYNAVHPRGISLRTAKYPWGPWSTAQTLFNPWTDKGYGVFMHGPRTDGTDDGVGEKGREKEFGGEYGPYQFGEMATGKQGETTVYFTMSTWNPYAVVLMKATLKLKTNLLK